MRYDKCRAVEKLEKCTNTITEVFYLAVRKSLLYANSHQVDDLCPKLAEWNTTFRWQFTKVRHMSTCLWNWDWKGYYCLWNADKILVVSVMFISLTNVTYSSNNSDVALEHGSLITFQILKPSLKVLLNYFALINSTCSDGSWLSLLHGWDHKSLYYNKGHGKLKLKEHEMQNITRLLILTWYI